MYYTSSGNLIKNPLAYSKTGAPMYKSTNKNNTKYTNVNEKTYIYCLSLENGKKYIGKTTNIDRRLQQHFNGNGAKVTQKFKPLDASIIDSCPGYISSSIEQKHTNNYINQYGYENVRGGCYTNSKTFHKTYSNSDNDLNSDSFELLSNSNSDNDLNSDSFEVLSDSTSDNDSFEVLSDSSY